MLEEAYGEVQEGKKKVSKSAFKMDEVFYRFAEKRKGGAEKIAGNTRGKGPIPLLTHYHFKAKSGPYSDAIQHKDTANKSKYFKIKAKEAYEKLKNFDKLTQREFQELTGIFEVYGEVCIESLKTESEL